MTKYVLKPTVRSFNFREELISRSSTYDEGHPAVLRKPECFDAIEEAPEEKAPKISPKKAEKLSDPEE